MEFLTYVDTRFKTRASANAGTNSEVDERQRGDWRVVASAERQESEVFKTHIICTLNLKQVFGNYLFGILFVEKVICFYSEGMPCGEQKKPASLLRKRAKTLSAYLRKPSGEQVRRFLI